jgi:WD40 repeat protein/serine/threonine protein kinase
VNQLPQSIPEILGQALELPETERSAYLAAVCGGDERLQHRVERLLAAVPKADQLLELSGADCSPTIDRGPSQTVGSLIGPYKLLEQIGEGGMGLVYMAEQQRPVRRLVALKVIKPGMDSKQVIARFEAERQALAVMDHPSIAKVLDAGTTDSGRPYFAMELVRGVPINEFCDEKRLTVRERLELIVQICQAVQHAHQKGIIHRDLKPTNVLVTMDDATPLPRVIDFGIAKALGQQLTEQTLHTGFAQLVGTPLYMSPEQAEMSHRGVDTRSDVYSLGVLLYELLTGTTPFDKDALSKAGLDEMRRIIREDEPPRPSTRVSTLEVQKLSTVSQRRSIDSRRISTTLRGEVDWIVMKALEKDRSRRYESASALAADIQRYLSDEPVLACPPTTMYRFQKFVKKHKAALTTAAAIALCLLLGTTVSAWQALRATTAEAQAEANEQKAVANAVAAQEKEQQAIKQRDEVKALADKLTAKEEDLQRTLYADHIHMAQAAWDSGDVNAMSQLLGQHVPHGGEADRRGFEWQYLNRLANIGPLMSIKTPMNIYSDRNPRLSPDRTRVVHFNPATTPTVTRKGKTPATPPILRAWNLQTGQQDFSVELAGVPDRVAFGQKMPDFTPDGAHLLFNTSYFDPATKKLIPGDLKVWDTLRGKEIFKLSGITNNIWFDNQFLAIRLVDKSVKICELATGLERLTLPGAVPDNVAFSPDGKHLAATYDEWDNFKKADIASEVKIWDIKTGQQLTSFKCQGGSIDHLLFSPDGQRLVTSTQALSIKLWDAQTGKDLLTSRWDVESSDESIDELRFNPDGTRLVVLGSYEHQRKQWVYKAKLLDTQTGQQLLSASADEVQFSPDGKRVALIDSDNSRTKVFDAHSGQIMLSVKDAEGPVAFSPDSKLLAAKCGGTRIWDLETGDEINHIKGFDPGLLLAFSQDGQRLIGSRFGASEVWDARVEQRSAKKILLPGIDSPWGISDGPAAISSDFTRIAGIAGKTIKLFDMQTGQELRTLSGHKLKVQCMAFSQDGKRLAASDGNSNGAGGRNANATEFAVKIWDTETGNEILTISGLPQRILRLTFSPDGKKLAGTPGDRSIKVWDAVSGAELYSIGPAPTNNIPQMFAFSPDGRQLAWQGRIRDAETGDVLLPLKNAVGNTGAFSPDGKRVVGRMPVSNPVVNRSRALNPQISYGVWDTETGELLFTTPGVNINGAGQPIFSPDGKRLAGDGKIWDAHTGQFLLSLTSDRTSQVAFSPDGHRLAVVKDYSNEVTIYDATPEKP